MIGQRLVSVTLSGVIVFAPVLHHETSKGREDEHTHEENHLPGPPAKPVAQIQTHATTTNTTDSYNGVSFGPGEFARFMAAMHQE